MGKTTKFEWAIGEWSDRGSLAYVPVDQMINGCSFTPRNGMRNCPTAYSDKVPVRIEETGEGVTYIAYCSGVGEILRITEENA